MVTIFVMAILGAAAGSTIFGGLGGLIGCGLGASLFPLADLMSGWLNRRDLARDAPTKSAGRRLDDWVAESLGENDPGPT